MSKLWFWRSAIIFVGFLVGPSQGVPNGFIDEGVAQTTAITGAFAPNPRKGGKPMLLLSSKEGTVRVLEDPDNSDDNFVIADLEKYMCHNGERGLQAIRPHPNFANNQFIYMFYARIRDGCLQDANQGPRNRLSRFKMNKSTLMIDLSSEFVLFETPPTPKRMHNGGSIAFGSDGKLYVTTGDAGSRNPSFSQDLGHLHGGILRLNDDGTIPSDNPYAGGVKCGKNGGKTSNGICAETFAKGLRNPFRLAMDPNTKGKVKFYVGDVGASTWEEISLGGTDYAKANYGWRDMEGPCNMGSTTDCPAPSKYKDPFYYYQHRKASEGGAVTGSAFVPDGLWPSKYKFLFADFIFGAIYTLSEDSSRKCRTCKPPVPGYRNETFHKQEDVVDIFFGPYKNTKALYVVSRSQKGPNIRRIRYTGNSNRSPVADIKVKNTAAVNVGDKVSFDGTGSSDPDGGVLTYKWDFGDGGTSTLGKPSHAFKKKGTFTVTLTVADKFDQTDQRSVDIAVGKPPTATMISPVLGDKFYVGEVFRLSGSAVDSSGKKLSSSQLFWEVRQHHGEHYHPFLDRKSGNNFNMEPAPGPEDFIAATNSYLEVIMYAVDDDGLSKTVSRILKPDLVKVNITSVPSGRQVLIDDYPVTTPKIITSWAKHGLNLNVKDDAPFVFKSWSDGGARSHTVTLPIGSFKSFQVTFVKGSTTAGGDGKVPLVKQVGDCSSSNKCGRCEGHCESSAECKGSLVCYKKGGRGKSVPGCIGIDNSNTDWCTVRDIFNRFNI